MYTPRQSIAVSTKSCPYDGIPFLSALRPDIYPYLPKALVETTKPASYMSLMAQAPT